MSSASAPASAGPATATSGAPRTEARRLGAVLALAALLGIVASLAAWALLVLIHQIQVGVYTGLPHDLGYASAPAWWPLPVLLVAGVLVALAIVALPGRGGHVPALGLATTPTMPVELPGVLLAALATVGLGLVLGPEAPLIALGGGLGILSARLVRRWGEPQLATLLGACGTFAALALIFESPLISAVLLIEATGVGGEQQRRVVVPGLLAAGVGSLVSIGMGSFTGLSTSDYALGALPLPTFPRPELVDFLWSILLALAVAVGTAVVVRSARRLAPAAAARPFAVLPAAALAVAGLAILFGQATDHGFSQVLFSGQDQLPGLVSGASTWSLGALALVLGCKGVAWSLCLASFRGGPTFPAMFLGAAGGVMASRLPGYALTPAVAVGMGAGVASMLRLPLSAAVLAILLTAEAGAGAMPLVIVGVVTAYLASVALDAVGSGARTALGRPAPAVTPSG